MAEHTKTRQMFLHICRAWRCNGKGERAAASFHPDIGPVLVPVGLEHRESSGFAGEEIIFRIFAERRRQIIGDNVEVVLRAGAEARFGHRLRGNAPAVAVGVFRAAVRHQPADGRAQPGEGLRDAGIIQGFPQARQQHLRTSLPSTSDDRATTLDRPNAP